MELSDQAIDRLYAAPDYRSFLQSELAARQEKRRGYSLRAFARDLELHPSTVSAVLRGRKGLSRDSADAIGHKLDFGESERAYFAALVSGSRATTPAASAVWQQRADILRRQRHYVPMRQDAIRALRDWEHGAIIELSRLAEFNADPLWIGSMLGLSPVRASRALARLERLGMLELSDDGKWVRGGDHRATEDVPLASIRELNRQLIAKALHALESEPTTAHDFATVTFPASRARLAQVKELVTRQRRELVAFLMDGPLDSVFVWTSQLFRIAPHRLDDSPPADPN